MEQEYIVRYASMSDRELLNLIKAKPSDDVAANYLILVKYNPLLSRIYNEIFNEQQNGQRIWQRIDWFDDCKSDLVEDLMGKDLSWSQLESIQNTACISSWLETAARRCFIKTKLKLTERYPNVISIDDTDVFNEPMLVNFEDLYENRERMAVVMEAISRLDDTERFCILKHMKGYEHKLIAEMLRIKWECNGTKVRSSKKDGGYVVPTDKYVSGQIKVAKKKILKYYNMVYNIK